MKWFPKMKNQTETRNNPAEKEREAAEDMRLDEVKRFLSWANGTLTPDANDIGTYGGMKI